MANQSMPGAMTFSGTGFIGGSGVSTRGEVFRLLDPMAFGSTLANLVATGQPAATLRSVSDRMILTTVAGMVISPPGALRPEVLVTSVAPMGAPAAPPSPAAPPPTPAQDGYLSCVFRCLGSKLPGLAVEEIIARTCGQALGPLAGLSGMSIVAAGPALTALAVCVAGATGLTVGSVLECFIACAPGMRLRPGPIELDDDDDDDDDDNGNEREFRSNGWGESSASKEEMARLTQLAAAVFRAAAARGVRLSPAQVAQILMQHQRDINAARAADLFRQGRQ